MMAAFASAADNQTQGPVSGIETQYIDSSVRPQDDFFKYLNGKWLKDAEIPSDKSSWGTFMKLRDDTQPQLREIIEADAKDPHRKAGTDVQKIGDLYASFMDEKKVEALGTRPLAGELHRIAALKDKKALPALVAHLSQIGVTTPYGIGVAQDARESTKYAAYVRQSGLGMPDRDYYLKKDDKRMAETLAKYEQHVARILALAGDKDAAAKARAIVAFETELAQAQWTKVELRDPVKSYNKVEVSKLGDMMPGYDLKAALAATGIGNKVDYVIVGQPSYLASLDKILAKTDLATLQAYFQW
jgi:predicted metalloendopeptidase